MRFFRRRPVVPVLRLSGPIGMATPLRPGLSLATLAEPIERAFRMSKTPTVAVSINSPGGSPVQSHLIYGRLRALAAENKKKIIVFADDVCASGGYLIALAGDEIWVDPSSILGSIGVVTAGFGLVGAIEKLGIERRVYTAGANKGSLDPFLPERADDIERLKAIQREIHAFFISLVRERRGARIRGEEAEIFSGAFWSGPKAIELGLADGVADMRTKLREIHGEEVRLRLVSTGGGFLARRLRRLPGMGLGSDTALTLPAGLPDDLIAAIETRALWSRFGL